MYAYFNEFQIGAELAKRRLQIPRPKQLRLLRLVQGRRVVRVHKWSTREIGCSLGLDVCAIDSNSCRVSLTLESRHRFLRFFHKSSLTFTFLLLRLLSNTQNGFVSGQDLFTVLGNIGRNPTGRGNVWNYVRSNWNYFYERYSFFPGSVSLFYDHSLVKLFSTCVTASETAEVAEMQSELFASPLTTHFWQKA